MKKDVLTHFSFLVAFFVFISLFRSWFSIAFIPFWLGGLLGTLFPYLDHLIYIYFLKPEDVLSKEATNLMGNKDLKRSWELLVTTRDQRPELIFHTAYFQLMFLALAFLVITSSGNLFGRGIVLAFSLHLLISQYIDLTENKNLDNWFGKIVVIADQKQRVWYLMANTFIVLAFGFLL